MLTTEGWQAYSRQWFWTLSSSNHLPCLWDSDWRGLSWSVSLVGMGVLQRSHPRQSRSLQTDPWASGASPRAETPSPPRPLCVASLSQAPGAGGQLRRAAAWSRAPEETDRHLVPVTATFGGRASDLEKHFAPSSPRKVGLGRRAGTPQATRTLGDGPSRSPLSWLWAESQFFRNAFPLQLFF